MHVIAGISRRGATPLIVFEGHMDSLGFQNLCDQFLLPFIRDQYPERHYLYMDNAPSHSIASPLNHLRKNRINHWKPPHRVQL